MKDLFISLDVVHSEPLVKLAIGLAAIPKPVDGTYTVTDRMLGRFRYTFQGDLLNADLDIWQHQCRLFGASQDAIDSFLAEAIAHAPTVPVANHAWIDSQCQHALHTLKTGLPMPATLGAMWDWKSKQLTERLFANLDMVQLAACNAYAYVGREEGNIKTRKIRRYLRSLRPTDSGTGS